MPGLADLNERDAVLKAIAEFDRLGRSAFLSKYGFGEARSYFLSFNGRTYDSKAIVGAAYGYQFPGRGPLGRKAFSGGEATVQPKLESLGFDVVENTMPETEEFTSARLTQGEIYPREQLIEMFEIADSTVNTGVFRPKGSRSIWLFVTRDKTSDRTQYHDRLDGDLLYWDGQTSGRSDTKIIQHEANGDELLVFYRDSKRQHPKAGFRYEGPFRYLQHKPGKPSSFVLERVRPAIDDPVSPDVPEFDPADIEDGRRKIQTAVAQRQGQGKFRRELMRAYNGTCAVTGCVVEPLLEAAHIHPYLGPQTNQVSNGLLLRADIHTLFDLGLLWIEADYRVAMAATLLRTEYGQLAGRPIRLPAIDTQRPSQKALQWHRDNRSNGSPKP